MRRNQIVSPLLQKCAETTLRCAGPGAAEFFARGIFPDPAALFPRRGIAAENRVRWVNRPADGRLKGLLFLDGSSFWPRLGAAKRAGWAIVQTTAEGDLVSAAYGPVAFDQCPFQEARDGEDFAAHMCAYLTEGPVDAFIDCQGTLDSIIKGEAYANRSGNERAHLWGPFHAAFDDGRLTAHKTKGHATTNDVECGRSTHWERKGNNWPDKYAKMGAELHGVTEADAWLCRGLTMIAFEAATWAGSQAAHMAALEQRDTDQLPSEATLSLEVVDEDGAPLRAASLWDAVAEEEEKVSDSLEDSQPPQDIQPARFNGHLVLVAQVSGGDGMFAPA